jgi:two-component system CheB/CheR fusion protein
MVKTKQTRKQTGRSRIAERADADKAPGRKQESADSSGSARSSAVPSSIVGIGASAGGLEAFEQLLSALPADTGMAFVLVQHLAPKHESILSELLSKWTNMPVIEVKHGMAVEPDHVYVIPPNADMTVRRSVLHLSALSPDRARRMPIDLFLRSLAEDQQSRAIGVILSGTASDGTLGIQAIKAHGGVTFAQSEDSAKYNAMPRSAAAAGHVDYVLPPDGIARELCQIASHAHIFTADETESSEKPGRDEILNKIYRLLRNFSRVDFSYYKSGTITRRITRRMFLRKVDSLRAYFDLLRDNSDEVEALFNDLLINVTGFFRDPEAFEALQTKAFPVMFKEREPGRQIRIWVPGCSTGEEAYSIAIALIEFLGDRASNLQIQIFGTDVSESIIQKARSGVYLESIAMDVSLERLQRFFQRVNGSYQISKTIRDLCLFARQDVGKDPPFSKLDIISCRNVMIYMGPALQKRIIPLFHYALKPNGILFLGSSETVGGFSELFDLVDKRSRIYRKKVGAAPYRMDFVPRYLSEDETKGTPVPAPRVDFQKIAAQILLSRYAPASVVVNEKWDIVQFVGQTGRFLDPTPGDASLNIMKMVKPGLQLELRRAFQRARRGGTVRKEGVLVEQNGMLRTVNFEIMPIKSIPGKQRYCLVVFEEGDAHAPKSLKPLRAAGARREPETNKSLLEQENKRLIEELGATREYLQSIIEEQRSTNEELRSANEEIQSSNEELQSINEELETAKEELQSTNEELTTVNEELQNRNDELTKVNNDLNNLLSIVNIPIIILGNDLRIRRFTPVSERVLNLIPTDVGRPITDIKSNLKMNDLHQVIMRVIDTLETQENEVEDMNGRWYSVKIRPYRTADNKIDGVIIVLLELDPRFRPGR